MNRNNGAQSSCVLLTMIISGCQHCWLWGFKIFPVPTQTSLPFPSFPRANRPQAALHYREACPSVFSERLSQIFTTWCVHTGLQHLPCHVLLAWTWIKTGVWLHRGHPVHLEAILVEEDLCSAQRGAKLSCWAGHFYSSRKLLITDSHCPPRHHIPLGKPSPWPFVSSSLCFLFPEFLHLKKAKISTEISIHSGSLCSAPCLGGAICWGVWFQAHRWPGFTCKPFNRVKLTAPKAYEFYLTCCQYFELSVALEGSLLSSRLFPGINRAQWHTEPSHLAGIQWVSPYE